MASSPISPPTPSTADNPPAERNAGSSSTAKILFISHEATRTGAPMFLLHFLRWLRRETDLEFEIILGKGGPLETEFAAVAKLQSLEQLTANPAALQSFGLIYSNTVCNAPLLAALPRGDIPVITHVHELDSGYAWVGARAMAGIIAHTSHFIACAEAVADRLRSIFSIPPDRISVHHEMIDGTAVVANAAAASSRQDHDIPADAFVLTGCGSLDLRKGPDLFLQAAARIKRLLGPEHPLRCLWIGAPNSLDLAEHLRLDARKLGLQDEFRLVGELPAPHALFAQSDIFCLTSREDPFPLVMLEAAALGKPILCFDGAGGAAEFCSHGGGRAVAYLDVEAMAATAVEWLLDPASRVAIGRRGAEVVRRHFTVEAIAPVLWKELQRHFAAPAPTGPLAGTETTLADTYRTWTLSEAPQLPYIEAHLRRESVRKQARLLAGQGRQPEAGKLLMRAVNADIELKDPLVAFESLVEIGEEMAALDARQSAALFGAAERFSRAHPHLQVENFRRKAAGA